MTMNALSFPSDMTPSVSGTERRWTLATDRFGPVWTRTIGVHQVELRITFDATVEEDEFGIFCGMSQFSLTGVYGSQFEFALVAESFPEAMTVAESMAERFPSNLTLEDNPNWVSFSE